MAKLIRLKLYICDFYENLDQKTMEVIIHRALNGTAGCAMTDIFEIEEKAITWADDNPINQLNATQETWDEQFGSKVELSGNSEQLPKLTEEELKRRGIKWPEWAKFAYSLDTCFALFCENDPRSCIEDWSLHPPEDIPGQWEPGGFIERPKLPDWCKVGV